MSSPTETYPRPATTSSRSVFGVNERIDVCRGLFAYLVVNAHAREMAWSMYPTVGPVETWERLLTYSVGTGIYWVMGFFVISGYCIQLSVDRAEASGGFQMKSYLAARLTRILPLYYLALLFALIVESIIASCRPYCWPDGVNARGLLSQLAGVQGCVSTFGCFGPSWSITNELFYYMFFGLLVVACSGRRHLPAVIGLVSCLVVGAGLQALHAFGPKSPYAVRVGMLFGLGVNWFLGALVAQHRVWLLDRRPILLIARAWPILLVGSMFLYSTERVRPGLIFILCGIAFALMLIRFHEQAKAASQSGSIRSRTFRQLAHVLGLSSYPTYLFHAPILMLIGALTIHWSLTQNRWLIWGVSAVVSLACGVALGFLAEQPIMAWRAALLSKWRRQDAGPKRRPVVEPAARGLSLIQRGIPIVPEGTP